MSVVGLIVRMLFVRQESIIRHAGTALRQAMLFSVLVIAALILKSQGLFNWWLTLILIVALALLEFFLLSIKRPDPNNPNLPECPE